MPVPIITTSADREIRLMLDRAQVQNTLLRQQDAADRLLILQGNWQEVAQGRVHRFFETPKIKSWVSKKVTTIFNLLGTLTDRVCVAYKTPPSRTLRGASEAVQGDWQKLLEQTRISTQAKAFERYAFGLNVFHAIPVVRPDPRYGLRTGFDVVLPHCCERTANPLDPSQTVSISYSVRDGSDRTNGRNPIVRCVLDAEAYYYLDDNGQLVGDPIPHGAGVFPGVEFRLAEAPPDDFWDSFRGSGVVDATLECAVWAARLSWIRSFQDSKREIFFSKRLQSVPDQVAGAHGPLQIPFEPNEGSYQVEDLITSIDEHVKHIKLLMATAAESVGVPATLLDPPDVQTAVNPLAAAQQHAALAAVRDDHIEHLRRSEAELWWKTALVMRAANHPLAKRLTPDLVADSFQITFPPLSFVDHPEVKARVWKEMVGLGLLSTFEAYREAHPELTPEEARDAVKRIAEEESELNEIYVQRNLPRAVDERRNNIAQIQGREGGTQKALNAATDEPADDGEAD